MKKILIPMLMITVFVSIASAEGIVQDGTNFLADRIGMINDGDFELGECGAGSAWTCVSTGVCPVIYDLSALGIGVPNFDGSLGGWLGGSCTGGPDTFDSLCQDIFIDGDLLGWYWNSFVVGGGDLIHVTVNGVVVHEYWTTPADHLAGWTQASANVTPWLGTTQTLCFTFDLIGGGGDNYFVDGIYLDASVATEDASFSTVKSMY